MMRDRRQSYVGTATVYAHIGADDEVLYVGCSAWIERRTHRHRLYSGWWPLVQAVELASLEMPRRQALDLERRLIETMQPRFNVNHCTGETFRVPPRRPRGSRLRQLADLKLPGGLDAFVDSRRPDCSWNRLALDLRDATGGQVDVTPHTLWSWYAPHEAIVRGRRMTPAAHSP